MPPTGPWRRLHVLHHRSCLLSRPSLCSNMTSPTRPGVRTRTCQVPRAPCPTGYPEAGPSADRCPSYDRRTRSNARNGHGGSWSSVPRAYRARCPTGRPRGTSPAADRDYQWPETDRNVSKRLETSRERRPRRATTGTPPGSVTASGTAPLMTRNPAWAFRIDKRPKSTLHGKTSTWRSPCDIGYTRNHNYS